MSSTLEERLQKVRDSNNRWKQNNKDKIKEYNRKYKLENREYINLSNHEYRWDNEGNARFSYRKSNVKSGWKNKGMVLNEGETWDEIFEIYETTTECMGCSRPFLKGEKRCLDHNHEFGHIRGVICYSCNKLDILCYV